MPFSSDLFTFISHICLPVFPQPEDYHSVASVQNLTPLPPILFV